ncbi:MAG: glycosyltransferase [Candidatus Acidiferrales bacterium]
MPSTSVNGPKISNLSVGEARSENLTQYRVLHVLDHSRPLLSGYSVRSHSLITAQKHIGLFPQAVTGPLHGTDDAGAREITIDDIVYRRSALEPGIEQRIIQSRIPVLREMSVVRLLRQRILEIVDEQTFDVIHAHSPALCGLAAMQAAKAHGIPFVYEIRAFWEDAAVDQQKTKVKSLRYQISRGLESYVSKRADAVVGIARHILEDLRERGIDSKKLFHVPNGVNAERFTALPRDAELAARLGLGDAPVFGFVGSLYRYEGIAWMVRASERLHREGVKFQILIVGHGEDSQDIQAAIQELRAQDYIKAVGQVPHEQVQSYYSLMDVLVYPRRSVRLTELTTPLKPLEAMAQRKAVLASDVGGIRELVEPEIPCLLFKADDVEDFCRKAKQLICDGSFREELAERGRQMILREKDWDVLAERYRAVYLQAQSKTR